MNIEAVKKVADKQFEELAAALERGQSEGLRTYLGALGRLHKYSFRNAHLIFAQRPDATHVAGFHAWKKLGRHVKKGEKGIAIIVPHLVRTEESTEDGKGSIKGFRATHVFDISQTEGAPLPGLASAAGDPGAHLGALRDFVGSKGITLTYSETLGGADGVSRGGAITLRAGLSGAEEFGVLVHELAHELLHHGAERAPSSKMVQETEAEAVACVVSGAIGLTACDAAADYIHLYQGDVETLRASLESIQRTATTILGTLLPGA